MYRQNSKQLAGFERLHDVKPGESRHVVISIPYEELRFFDVISDSLVVEKGEYTFFAGKSSDDDSLKTSVYINGVTIGKRKAGKPILCDRFDDYENIELVEGICGFEAATQLDKDREAKLVYRDFEIDSQWKYIKLFADVKSDFAADIYINGEKAGSFGDDNGIELNASKEHINSRGDSIVEADILIPVAIELTGDTAEIEIRFSGNDAKICYIEVLE